MWQASFNAGSSEGQLLTGLVHTSRPIWLAAELYRLVYIGTCLQQWLMFPVRRTACTNFMRSVLSSLLWCHSEDVSDIRFFQNTIIVVPNEHQSNP